MGFNTKKMFEMITSSAYDVTSDAVAYNCYCLCRAINWLHDGVICSHIGLILFQIFKWSAGVSRSPIGWCPRRPRLGGWPPRQLSGRSSKADETFQRGQVPHPWGDHDETGQAGGPTKSPCRVSRMALVDAVGLP